MQETNLIIFCDGGSRGNPGPAASAFIITNQDGQTISEQGFYLGSTTNNQAEYQAVVEALKFIGANFPQAKLTFNLDSQLVVNQINGTFKVKDPNIQIKYNEVKDLIKQYELNINPFMYVPRAQNSRADLLVNQTLDKQTT